MGAGHHRPLYVDTHSVLHRLPAEAKIIAAVGFVCAIVATPREAFWAGVSAYTPLPAPEAVVTGPTSTR